MWGAALRYALLAEQGHSLAQLNLAWLLHRGGVVAGAERHRLALPLWLRAAACNQTEGMLMAGHLLRDGHKWGLPGGEALGGGPPAGQGCLHVALTRAAAAAPEHEGCTGPPPPTPSPRGQYAAWQWQWRLPGAAPACAKFRPRPPHPAHSLLRCRPLRLHPQVPTWLERWSCTARRRLRGASRGCTRWGACWSAGWGCSAT